MRTLIIDHYDSFTMNLAQLLAVLSGTLPWIRPHDDPCLNLEFIRAFDLVILSPGPGHPAKPQDFAFSRRILAVHNGPLLGICLGFQGICLHEGADIVRIAPAHGIISAIVHDQSPLFSGLPNPWPVVRYHSLAVQNLPNTLIAHAWTDDTVLMAVSHRSLPRWGVQFHPESIGTLHGKRLLHNVLTACHQTHYIARAAIPESIRPSTLITLPTATTIPLLLQHHQIPWRHSAAILFHTFFAQSPTAFWLDSPPGVAENSRFSIMGDAAGEHAVHLCYYQQTQTLILRHGSQEHSLHTPLFEWLRLHTPTLHIPEPLSAQLACDFQLGWIGYMGYEMRHEIQAPTTHTPPSPYPDAQWIWCDRVLIIDHQRNTLDILWAHSTTDSTWSHYIAKRCSQITSTNPIPPHPPIPTSNHWQLQHSKNAYLQLIASAQEFLQAGDSYELCLTNKIVAHCTAHPLDLYLRMRQLNPAPFAAYLRFVDTHILCGSPEQFVRRHCDGRLSSSPIKGTRPRHPDPATDQALLEDLAHSSKDRSENLMIVDLIRHDMGHCCLPTSIDVPQLQQVKSFSHAHQMISTIEGQTIRSLDPWTILARLFPGGSMTGAPKQRSMQLLQELELNPRGIYSGCLGYISSLGCMNLNIIIRSLIVQHHTLSYGIGGAITVASEPEAEFAETLVKAKPLFDLFGLDATVIDSDVL